MDNADLDQLLKHPAIWRGGHAFAMDRAYVSSGFAALDAELPGAGWPVGALTELLVDDHGIGEISLLLPALRNISSDGKGITFISPLHLPFARAWQATQVPLDRILIIETTGNDLLWSAEQVLKSGSCGAALIWGQRISWDYRKLQRLHLAAENGGAIGILYRPLRAQTTPSAAPLRMTLTADKGALMAHIIKRRGSTLSNPIRLSSIYPEHWHIEPPLREDNRYRCAHLDTVSVPSSPSPQQCRAQ